MAHATKEKVTKDLVYCLLNPEEQLELFDARTDFEKFKAESVKRLKKENPDKIILSNQQVDEYRFEAAYRGAGFHPSQYEDVRFKENSSDEVGRFVIGLWGNSGYIPRLIGRGTKMFDEIKEEIFTDHVPSAKYDLSSQCYIVTADDLKKIFEYDYENLALCRDMGMQLIYDEGE